MFVGLAHLKSAGQMSRLETQGGRGDDAAAGPWDFLAKSIGVGCHFLLQGIFSIWNFPTQELNPDL